MTNTSLRGDSQIDYRVVVGLWILSIAIYLPLLGRWSLSGDEFYTYEDSTFSIAKLLSFNSRPLYFIVCHFLLKWSPGLPIELVIRLPAMLTASLMAPCIYGLLGPSRFGNLGLLAALLAMFNPWLFQMSQFGRYYSFVLFFAMLATVAALRYLEEPRHRRWPVLFFLNGVLAAVSHPPAALLIPAGIVGWIISQFREDPATMVGWLKRYGPLLLGILTMCGGIGVYLLQDLIREWLGAKRGDFGGHYDVKGILISLAVVGGLSSWSLAIIPLFRFPTSWSTQDVFLVTVLIVGSGPLLLLVPFGGGVSSRYFLYCLPCMFLLAAQHWRQIDARLPSMGYRFAFGFAIIACNVSQLLSIATDGNHFDFRTIGRVIENLDIENPIIFASSHRLVDYYLDDRFEVQNEDADDLGEFGVGVPREVIERAITLATKANRPLLLVSRQDRTLLTAEDQQWLYSRFAVLQTIERARYDHRRYRVILYQYRPMSNGIAESASQQNGADK